jgi:serine/threonine-protein kinase
MLEVFANHVLVRRLDSGGHVEFYEARIQAAQTEPARLLIRLPKGATRWPPWADPALAKILVHPNIVRLLDCRLLDARPFAILEFTPGLDLRELIAVERLPVELSCFIVAEVCRGLMAALGSQAPNGTMLRWSHGQICPRAIRISPSGQVKISGFGIGRLKPEGEPSITTLLDERLLFLAPEQAAGEVQENVDPEVDVFLLGAILHASCSTKRLAVGDTPTDYLRDFLRIRKTHKTFSRLDDQVSQGLREVVARMLASDPGERMGDAGEVLRALGSVPELRDRALLASKLGAVVQRQMGSAPRPTTQF